MFLKPTRNNIISKATGKRYSAANISDGLKTKRILISDLQKRRRNPSDKKGFYTLRHRKELKQPLNINTGERERIYCYIVEREADMTPVYIVQSSG